MTGLGWLDEIGLPAADSAPRSRDLLAAHAATCKRVVAGHVHRVIGDTLGGCGVVTCASTNIQAGPGLHRHRDGRWPNEPPSLLVHALLDSGDLITHVQPI